MRGSRDLVLATREFARENRLHSWWHLGSTLFILLALVGIGTIEIAWWMRLPVSILAGLVLVRTFVIYHDQQHGAILRGSRLANAVMTMFGLAILNPPSVWKRSHDHHHHNNSKSYGLNVGSYPLLTTDLFDAASRWEKFRYLASRNPLTIAAAYLTAFLFGMCLVPLGINPRRHWDAGVSLLLHAGIVILFSAGGIDDLLLAILIPSAIGSALGAYLFYAQHNFPGASLRTGENWDYTFAALHSSSYMQMGPVMNWFTGNIGYHHVHHLNSQIPFYRLPETMNAIEELQSPATTSLHPRNILACLRLKLWDVAQDKLVPVPCGPSWDFTAQSPPHAGASSGRR